MSVDRSKHSRMPSRKLRDTANDAEPEVTSHHNARHSAPSAPTAGTSSKQQSSAVVVDKAQAQINHPQVVASTVHPAPTNAGTGSKRQSVDDDEQITIAEGK